VTGKHKETLVESCYQNIIGPHIVLNNNVRNETRLGVFTKTYGENWIQQHSWGNVSQMDQNYLNIVQIQCANTSTDFESFGVQIEGCGVHGELIAVHGEVQGFHAEENLIHFSDDALFSNQDKLLDNRFKGVDNKIKGVSERVAGVEEQTKGLESTTSGMSNWAGIVCLYEGAENHTGPAVFEVIASPMIFP
jgi:hypothetical protein